MKYAFAFLSYFGSLFPSHAYRTLARANRYNQDLTVSAQVTAASSSSSNALVNYYPYSRELTNSLESAAPHYEYLIQALQFISRNPKLISPQEIPVKIQALLENDKNLKWDKNILRQVLKKLVSCEHFPTASKPEQEKVLDHEIVKKTNEFLGYRLCQLTEGKLTSEDTDLLRQTVRTRFLLVHHGLILEQDAWEQSDVSLETIPKEWTAELFLVELGLTSCDNLVPFLRACSHAEKLSPEIITVLCLKKNRLKNLPPNFFDELRSLEILDLSNNEIESITGDCAQKASHLKKLNLNDNKLVYFPQQGFSQLEILILCNNPLRYIILNKPFLQVATLVNNKLHGLIVAGACKKLGGIDARNNCIEYLPSYFFENVPQLKVLVLLDNPLREVPRRHTLQSTQCKVESPELTHVTQMQFSLLAKFEKVALDERSVGNIRRLVYSHSSHSDSTRRATTSGNTNSSNRNSVGPLVALIQEDNGYVVNVVTPPKSTQFKKFETSNKPTSTEMYYFDAALRFVVYKNGNNLSLNSIHFDWNYQNEKVELSKEYDLPSRFATDGCPLAIRMDHEYFVIKGQQMFQVYERNKAKPLFKIKPQAPFERSFVALHPLRKLVALALDRDLEIWDFDEKILIKKLPHIFDYSFESLAYSNNGTYLIAVGEDWTIKFLNAATGEIEATFYGTASIDRIFFNDDTKHAVVFFNDKKPARIYNILTHGVQELQSSLDKLFDFTFVDGSQYILVGRNENSHLLEAWSYDVK